MDPVIFLESKMRRAQANKKSVMAVFFDVDNAYDVLRKVGVMVKLDMIGIAGRTYNC